MRKLMSKPLQEGLLFSLPMFACKEENLKFLHFEFMKCVTQMKRSLKQS